MALKKKTRTIEVPFETSAEVPRGALNIEEFAENQGIGRTIVYRLLMDGSIRSYKIGRRRLIPCSETADFPARMLAKAQEQEVLS